MKLIYMVILFLIFFNVFTFLFVLGGPVGIFPYAYDTGNPGYDIGEGENMSSEAVFENASEIGVSDVFNVFFGSDDTALWTTLLMMGGAIALAYITHSPAPFVVVFVGNIMKNIYMMNRDVFNQFPVNNYLMLVVGIGMIILLLVTCAEYLTSGHGEV